MPAAWAGPETLKGPRTRLSTSATAWGQKAQPRRKDAKPWILEKVRVMTTLSWARTSAMPGS